MRLGPGTLYGTLQRLMDARLGRRSRRACRSRRRAPALLSADPRRTTRAQSRSRTMDALFAPLALIGRPGHHTSRQEKAPCQEPCRSIARHLSGGGAPVSARFRREFATEMARDFDEATDEAWRDGAWPGVFSAVDTPGRRSGPDADPSVVPKRPGQSSPCSPATFTVVGIGTGRAAPSAGPVTQPRFARRSRSAGADTSRHCVVLAGDRCDHHPDGVVSRPRMSRTATV